MTLLRCLWASLIAQLVKNLPAMQEIQQMQVWSLGQEGSLEEEMATHSSILAWKIPWTEEPGRLQSLGSHRVGDDWSNLAHTSKDLWRRHGNPLQYSCLGNPTDRGAWRATVHGVARVGHDLVTKPPPPLEIKLYLKPLQTQFYWDIIYNTIRYNRRCSF